MAGSSKSLAQVTSLGTAIEIGTGSAFQSVAQSSAAAVADGAQYLRNVEAVSAAAIATMTAGMVAQTAAGGGPNSPGKYEDGIKAVTQNVTDTVQVFSSVGQAAAGVLQAFKSLK